MSKPPSQTRENCGQTTETEFSDKPSPWMNMKAQFFWTIGRAKCLPKASYADLEGQSTFADPTTSGQFKGRACTVMIVRYLETPVVGPYDEILWMPGWFEVPDKGISRPRVTRIYVSKKESIYNGRKNWNIPKHLANFKFTPSDTPSTIPYSRVEITLPSTPDQPFVALDFSPTTILSKPSIPISSSRVPIDLGLHMPPIPESKSWKEDAMVGTKEWRHARVDISGWARVIHVKGTLGNGTAFPEFPAGGYWLYINDAKMNCVTL
ncbi:hypothetical protein PABG_05191 [Paracoccidioides brasiliensis Pb03]|nr:hypothetical protein PABG_05191 [Paracoccidioides brasiliensis Pb03]